MEQQKNTLFSFVSKGNEINQTNIIGSSCSLQEYLTNLTVKRERSEDCMSSLVYDSCPVDLIGRENELKELEDFVGDERGMLWWAVTGLPGSGKTRLAYDFVKSFDPKGDWIARFLPWPVFAKDVQRSNLSIDGCNKNMLIVIDYMYAYEEQIASWFEWLFLHYNGTIKLRILIIEREYVCNGKQLDASWQNIFKNGFAQPSNYYRLRYKRENLNLNDKSINEEHAFKIVRCYSGSQGKWLTDGLIQHIITLVKKTNRNIISPLLLLLVTEYYLEERDAGYHADIYNVILSRIVEREELALYKLMDVKTSIEKQKIRNIVLIATIVSNLSIENGLTTISDAFCMSVDEVREYLNKFIDTPMVYLNGDTNGFIRGIQPDLIGEYFVYEFFEKMSDEKTKKILDIIYNRHRRALLSFLARFLADNAYRLRGTGKYDIFYSYIPGEHRQVFEVVDDEGKLIECEVLLTYENSTTGRNYIVYTDNTQDSEGNTRVYASIYNPDDDMFRLIPIQTRGEWRAIEIILSELQKKVREEGVILDEEKMEEFIEKKLMDIEYE